MPTAIIMPRHQGLETIELVAPDGARATVLLHGAHVVSWRPVGGDEQLYLSPQSAFADGQAVRGGVPVIFPQFSARGTGPRHGFARTRSWQLVHEEQGRDDALAVLRLTDDAATRAIWPHAFELELSVRVSGGSLDIELACENRGAAPFDFSAALHTYLRVQDLDAVSVQGLAGLRYWDAVLQGEGLQRTELLLPGGAGVSDLDRIYFQVRQALSLVEQTGTGSERRVQITQQGFDDAVLWNPGPERCAALADMPADGYRHMLCIEAATIGRPVVLAPGESWVGRQSLSLL